VLNNEFLGMVRQWQQLFLTKIRFYRNDQLNFIATSRLASKEKSHQKRRFDGAVAEMLASPDSYFLEWWKRKYVFPMIPTGSIGIDIRLFQ
jgi:acetolactate synthase-1/2/3 large subunit